MRTDCPRGNIIYMSDSITPGISHVINPYVSLYKASLQHMVALSANVWVFLCFTTNIILPSLYFAIINLSRSLEHKYRCKIKHAINQHFRSWSNHRFLTFTRSNVIHIAKLEFTKWLQLHRASRLHCATWLKMWDRYCRYCGRHLLNKILKPRLPISPWRRFLYFKTMTAIGWFFLCYWRHCGLPYWHTLNVNVILHM